KCPAKYVVLSKDKVGSTLGKYERSKQLIIDPVLQYSTYLAGSFTNCNDPDCPSPTIPASDSGRAIALDSSRHAYVAGNTDAADFPTTSNAFIKSVGAGCHPHGCFSPAFVTKFSVDGKTLLYSTYLYNINGLEDEEEVDADGIAVNAAGQAFITGVTFGGGFPTTSNAFLTGADTGGGAYAYLTGLNASGSGLVYSTYLVSSGNEEGTGIRVDGSDAAYVTGTTSSLSFPHTGTFGGTSGGGAFVSKLNSTGSALLYSVLIGGPQADVFGISQTAIAVDGSGNAYIAGSTGSANFPHTSGALQSTFGGAAADGF